MLPMRHKSVETTMKFYVGRNARTASDVLWQVYSGNAEAGNSFGNSPQTKTAS